MTAEEQRLAEDARRDRNWKRWGPYLSERQWGTVREDYSADGAAWSYFPHDHARSRAYRWGEDGLLGWTDRECRLCFAPALWNERDPILKERLFGLTNDEGNHGEDVKELYAYLDATPTYSYARALYRYPTQEYPYQRLIDESRRRGLHEREFELQDTGLLDDGRYVDAVVEYAKNGPDDICIRLTLHNRGPDEAPLHVLPTLWFRNTWAWGCRHEGCSAKPRIEARGGRLLRCEHETLGVFFWELLPTDEQPAPALLFTENETNVRRLFGTDGGSAPAKDAFHEAVVHGRADALSPRPSGTRAAAHHRLRIPPGESRILRWRLVAEAAREDPLDAATLDAVMARRLAEADAFYAATLSPALDDTERRIAREAFAGLLWTRQFYHLFVGEWLRGDPDMPPPPPGREAVRNADWRHLYTRDVLSMPDKWEYPWFAAWDLAFHMVPMARVDPEFAKHQLLLLLREWYMHPSGAIPAYEFNFNDVNPPVHAWACWRVYKITARHGARDLRFLASAFQKLLINFTWWVNRKDRDGNHLFAGGFLGLDNIGVFDRSKPLLRDAHLEQADATAWMAFYAGTMLAMALELAIEDPVYEDMASKFFEHFIAIADAMNHVGGSGLWHEQDGFYYDQIAHHDRVEPLRARSLVGLIPLLAVEVLHAEVLERLPGFRKRLRWFLTNRSDLQRQIALLSGHAEGGSSEHLLLAIPCRDRLQRVLRRLCDEGEFLSPHGFRSLSKAHATEPFAVDLDGGETHPVRYTPGESDTWMFGGNSNWRGPVWFPVNYLLCEALERYDHFYGDSLTIEYPTGSGRQATLGEVAADVHRRLTGLFRPDRHGRCPCHGEDPRFEHDPHWRDVACFHEYFDGDTGRGLGAAHQTGWTSLVASSLAHLARRRTEAPPPSV